MSEPSKPTADPVDQHHAATDHLASGRGAHHRRNVVDHRRPGDRQQPDRGRPSRACCRPNAWRSRPISTPPTGWLQRFTEIEQQLALIEIPQHACTFNCPDCNRDHGQPDRDRRGPGDHRAARDPAADAAPADQLAAQPLRSGAAGRSAGGGSGGARRRTTKPRRAARRSTRCTRWRDRRCKPSRTGRPPRSMSSARRRRTTRLLCRSIAKRRRPRWPNFAARWKLNTRRRADAEQI